MTEEIETELAAERLLLAFELVEFGEEIMRSNLEREFPDADEPEIERRLGAWIEARSGALLGDCPGTPRPWHRVP